MPWAADGIANHEPVPQRAVVVRALRPDREHVIPAADEQDGFTAGMADELTAIGKVGEGDALDKIGAARLGCSFRHALLPCRGVYTDRATRIARSMSAFALGAGVAVWGVALQELDHQPGHVDARRLFQPLDAWRRIDLDHERSTLGAEHVHAAHIEAERACRPDRHGPLLRR